MCERHLGDGGLCRKCENKGFAWAGPWEREADPRAMLLGGNEKMVFAADNRPKGPYVEEPEAKVLEAALKYWEQCISESSRLFSLAALRKVGRAGDVLVQEAGHWTVAMEALRYAWEATMSRGHVGDIWHPYWERISRMTCACCNICEPRCSRVPGRVRRERMRE